jgi:hypothetical protein
MFTLQQTRTPTPPPPDFSPYGQSGIGCFHTKSSLIACINPVSLGVVSTKVFVTNIAMFTSISAAQRYHHGPSCIFFQFGLVVGCQ